MAKQPRMTKKQYLETLDRLGVSNTADSAELLGVDPRTARRWAAGERIIRGPAVQFLNFLIAKGINAETVVKTLG
jgi:DNA-binding transcriptional regulator YiaG